jgi:DNA-binding NtrC family response regulator
MSTLRLLVIDRTPGLDDELRQLADELDIRLVLCPSLTDAFCAIKRVQPDVAVIDANLLEHLGTIGAVRAVRVLAPDCDVVLTSVDPLGPDGLEAVRAGALECMPSIRSMHRLRTILVRARSGLQRAKQALLQFERSLSFHRPSGPIECSL